MSACAFFGHRDCPDTVKPLLYGAIEELITEKDVDMFYVGNQGQFDAYARSTLRQLQAQYPHIRYAVVLAYLPGEKREDADYSDTMFPEVLDSVHPRYALDRRNRWMVEQVDHIICCIRHPWGGAYQYVRLAAGKGKRIINLLERKLDFMQDQC